MAEKFSWVKLLKSPLTGMYWVKIGATIFGLFVIGAIGYTGFRVFTKPTTDQKATTIVNNNYNPVAHFGGCASVPIKNSK